jgi:hypothetical protein
LNIPGIPGVAPKIAPIAAAGFTEVDVAGGCCSIVSISVISLFDTSALCAVCSSAEIWHRHILWQEWHRR